MPESPAGRALVVGEALVDVRHDTRVDPPTVAEHPGGSPLNIAVALARLGIPTTLATQLGDDEGGAMLERHVTAAGVELARLEPAAPTSTATAVIGADGTATYAFDLVWAPDQLPDPGHYSLVHVGSIGAALAPGADRVAELVAAAAAAGVPVSFDPNVRPRITPDLVDVRRRAERIADAAAVLKLSDEDAAELYPSLDPWDAALARRLADRYGAPLVVVTHGESGMVVAHGDEWVWVPAPPVDVVDTIGAGDTVTAAVLAGALRHGLLDRDGWPEAEEIDVLLGWLGTLAVRTAAITCGRAGADPPWRHEIGAL